MGCTRRLRRNPLLTPSVNGHGVAAVTHQHVGVIYSHRNALTITIGTITIAYIVCAVAVKQPIALRHPPELALGLGVDGTRNRPVTTCRFMLIVKSFVSVFILPITILGSTRE